MLLDPFIFALIFLMFLLLLYKIIRRKAGEMLSGNIDLVEIMRKSPDKNDLFNFSFNGFFHFMLGDNTGLPPFYFTFVK